MKTLKEVTLIKKTKKQLFLDKFPFHKCGVNRYICKYCRFKRNLSKEQCFTKDLCQVKVRKIKDKFYYEGTCHHEHPQNDYENVLVHEEIDEIIEKNCFYKAVTRDIIINLKEKYKYCDLSQNSLEQYYSRKLNQKLKHEYEEMERQFETMNFVKYKCDEFVLLYEDSKLEIFNQSRTVFGDGTFKFVPEDREQLYVLMAETDDGKKVPVFYCLLTGNKSKGRKSKKEAKEDGRDKERKKKEVTNLELMFNKINEVTGRLFYSRKFTFMGDMEILNIKCLRNNTNITLKCCNFHYIQALIRRSRKIYPCSKQLVKDLVSLSIAPIERVKNLFDFVQKKYLVEESEHYENDKKMLEYFEKNYINKKNCGIESWNVSEEKERTNNACETFNRVLNYYFEKNLPFSNKKKPNLHTFLVILSCFIKYVNFSFSLERKESELAKKRTEYIQAILNFENELDDENLIDSLGTTMEITRIKSPENTPKIAERTKLLNELVERNKKRERLLGNECIIVNEEEKEEEKKPKLPSCLTETKELKKSK